jgi:ribosomal protein L37AE/L43A
MNVHPVEAELSHVDRGKDRQTGQSYYSPSSILRTLLKRSLPCRESNLCSQTVQTAAPSLYCLRYTSSFREVVTLYYIPLRMRVSSCHICIHKNTHRLHQSIIAITKLSWHLSGPCNEPKYSKY